jgi:hypothetical protein
VLSFDPRVSLLLGRCGAGTHGWRTLRRKPAADDWTSWPLPTLWPAQYNDLTPAAGKPQRTRWKGLPAANWPSFEGQDRASYMYGAWRRMVPGRAAAQGPRPALSGAFPRVCFCLALNNPSPPCAASLTCPLAVSPAPAQTSPPPSGAFSTPGTLACGVRAGGGG